MDSAKPHLEPRPDPRGTLVESEPGATPFDDDEDTALLRLVGAVATALVALAAASSLLP